MTVPTTVSAVSVAVKNLDVSREASSRLQAAQIEFSQRLPTGFQRSWGLSECLFATRCQRGVRGTSRCVGRGVRWCAAEPTGRAGCAKMALH